MRRSLQHFSYISLTLIIQVRASVHYFNNEEDMDNLMLVLREVIEDDRPEQEG